VDQLLISDAQRKGFIRGKATQMKGFIRRKVVDQLFHCSCVLDTTHPIPNPMKTYENNSNPKGSTSKKPPNLPFMNKHHGNDPNSQQPNTRPRTSSWILNIHLIFTSFPHIFPLIFYMQVLQTRNPSNQMKFVENMKHPK